MQPTLQVLLTTTPLSLLEHLTAGWGAMGFIWMTLRGQTAVQAVQPVHLLRSTTATPLTTWMASNLQARVQSPRPRQPYEQALGPPATAAAAAQVWMPL